MVAPPKNGKDVHGINPMSDGLPMVGSNGVSSHVLLSRPLCSSPCGRWQPWGLETTYENCRQVLIFPVKVNNCSRTRKILGIGFRVEGYSDCECRISFGIKCNRYLKSLFENLGAGIDGVDGFEMRAKEESVVAAPRDLQHVVA